MVLSDRKVVLSSLVPSALLCGLLSVQQSFAGAIVGDTSKADIGRSQAHDQIFKRDGLDGLGYLHHVTDRQGTGHGLRGFAEYRAMKTGTTIAGVVFEGGVVLGADTRATGGQIVCDRDCDKIHILAGNMACCGAGTSADAVRITESVRFALIRMAHDMQACVPPGPPGARKTERSTAATTVDTEDGAGRRLPTRSAYGGGGGLEAIQCERLKVAAAAYLLKRHLFRYQGTVSAALVLGGVDAEGPHVYQIQQGGSFDEVLYTAMGSGSLAALSVLERGYRDEMAEQEARELVMDAIAAGIDNDLGSGSNIDICVIRADRVLEHHRGVWKDPGLPSDTGTGDKGMGGESAPDTVIPRCNFEEKAAGQGIDDSPMSSDGPKAVDVHPRSEDASIHPRSSAWVEGRDTHVAETGRLGVSSLPSSPWMGAARKRQRHRKVVRVDEDSGELRSVRHSSLDDRVELL